MHSFTNAEFIPICNMVLTHHIKQLSSISKNYLLLCIKLLLHLQEFCDIFHCHCHASKHETVHSRTTFNEEVQMLVIWYIVTQQSSHYFFEQPFHFLMKVHTYNAYDQTPNWCNDACFLKSILRMKIKATEVLLSINIIIAL